MGLVLALALLFAGLEYTTRPSLDDDDASLLDDFAEDMELPPAMDQRDMISATPSPASKAITQHLKEVESATNDAEKLSTQTNDLSTGNGESSAQETPITEALPQTPMPEDSTVYSSVEKLPEFPGGMVNFMKWLTRTLQYPNVAQRQRLQGKVVVTFIVNKDGTISEAKVAKSVNPMLDQEALRVIRMMPNWKPGSIKGKPCRTMFAIPVNFKL